MDAIQSEEDYCLYSPTKGPISSHMTAINAIKAFALILVAERVQVNPEAGGVCVYHEVGLRQGEAPLASRGMM